MIRHLCAIAMLALLPACGGALENLRDEPAKMADRAREYDAKLKSADDLLAQANGLLDEWVCRVPLAKPHCDFLHDAADAMALSVKVARDAVALYEATGIAGDQLDAALAQVEQRASNLVKRIKQVKEFADAVAEDDPARHPDPTPVREQDGESEEPTQAES